MAQKIVAFVAKSFAPEDEAKIAPITKFLESFSRLGFIPQSAERSEVESVSEKVRSLIHESDVLVGIFTKRHPLYRLQGRLQTAISVILGNLDPWAWSAPPWVLQESGYALKGNKSLILFRETGVEIPALQGDLEYIPFDPQNPAPALQRASEMITDLIAKSSRISVETVVKSESGENKQAELVAPPKTPESETKPDEGAEEDSFLMRLHSLFRTARSRDWEKAEREYEDGLRWVHEHNLERELSWKCWYPRVLFSEGRTDALDKLRVLAAQNEGQSLPWSFLAACYVDLHEYEEATKCYLHAASIAEPKNRASLEIHAAEVLEKAKKPIQARKVLLTLRGSDYAKEAKTQFQILERLYSLSKETEDKFGRFAIAELALHHSPEQSTFRFTLAFDYDSGDFSYLSMYHYKIICEHDEKNSAALNNLGIALANCELPVLAVQSYKQSLELGETLAASNLGRKYIDAGLTDEATALLKGVQGKENCSPEVARSIALAHERTEENNRGQEKALARAQEHREFLISFAEGLLSPLPINLDGQWNFPTIELSLKCTVAVLHGFREIRTQVNRDPGMIALFGGGGPKSITKVERFEFSGTLSGRTCKFKLVASKHEDPASWSFLGGPSESTLEGYILFAEDGLSGWVAELKDGKPEKYYMVSKSI